MPTQGCSPPVRLPSGVRDARMRPPSGMSAIASRAPTSSAFACESIAVSHCSSVISAGGWKNVGTSGRALLTKMSTFPKASRTLRNMRAISSGRVTSAWTTIPSDPRFRTSSSVSRAARSFW